MKVTSGGSGSSQPPRWGTSLLFDQVFSEDCIKMKEGGPLDPPMATMRIIAQSKFLSEQHPQY